MIPPKRPNCGFPWEQPGFTFSIGWPTGYIATAADSHVGKSTLENSINARQGREASAEAGTGWKNGTIAGLGKHAGGAQ